MNEGSVVRTLVFVGVIAAAAALLVTSSHEFSKDRIAANERAKLMRSLFSVLDPAMLEEDLNPILLNATDDLLGSAKPVDVFVVIDDGRPVAAIFASIAPEGYNAPIQLLIGIDPGGEITGVRAVSHRETPGLGDEIDIAKSNWIKQFDGKSLGDPPIAGWAVKQDEGQFDSITGATVTPRAVIKAVKNTLLYFSEHKDELFAAAGRVAAAGDDGTNE